jgi:hypothetical protein
MTKREEYTGLLAEPMYNPTLLSSDAETAKWALARAMKTVLLFKHFGIDPNAVDAWQRLAIALAEAHVPGFRPPPPKQGRPKTYDLDITLLMLFRLIRLRNGLNVRQAAERISERGKLPQNAEALRGRYRQASRDKYLTELRCLLDRFESKMPKEQLIEALEAGVGEYVD